MRGKEVAFIKKGLISSIWGTRPPHPSPIQWALQGWAFNSRGQGHVT